MSSVRSYYIIPKNGVSMVSSYNVIKNVIYNILTNILLRKNTKYWRKDYIMYSFLISTILSNVITLITVAK